MFERAIPNDVPITSRTGFRFCTDQSNAQKMEGYHKKPWASAFVYARNNWIWRRGGRRLEQVFDLHTCKTIKGMEQIFRKSAQNVSLPQTNDWAWVAYINGSHVNDNRTDTGYEVTRSLGKASPTNMGAIKWLVKPWWNQWLPRSIL